MTRFRGEYIKDRKALHNAVRAEAGNRCVRCGHPQGDRYIITTDPFRIDELEVSGWSIIDRAGWSKNGIPEWGAMLSRCDDRCTHERLPQKLRILTVHHLTGQKDDNRWWNLLALCQVCHLQIQGKVIPEVPYLWAHTEWFKPYACGFYAWFYGKQDITREQAEADPDRWLKLGQPWLYATSEPA